MATLKTNSDGMPQESFLRISMVEELLVKGVDVNSQDIKDLPQIDVETTELLLRRETVTSKNLLYSSACGGDKDVDEQLLVQGVDVNRQGINDLPQIDVETTELLLRGGALTSNGLLYSAACGEDKNVDEQLLVQGVDLNCQGLNDLPQIDVETTELLLSGGAASSDGLLYSADCGVDKYVDEQLQVQGVDVNSLDINDLSQIYVETTELLLSGGAASSDGLLYSADCGVDKDVDEQLQVQGVDLNRQDINDLPQIDVETTELLLSGGAASSDGLLYSADFGEDKNVDKHLLVQGVDLNRQGINDLPQIDVETTELLLRGVAPTSDSLLYSAVRSGLVKDVEVMVRNGANVNSRDDHGQTLLHHAILQDSAVFTFLKPSRSPKVDNIKEVVRVLLTNGSDVNVKTENGFSPLHYAVHFKYSDVVHILLEYGADFQSLVECNIKSPKISRFHQKARQSMTLGRLNNTCPRLTSLLHIATESNDVSSMLSLLDSGAAVDTLQYDGQTPLVIAVKRRHKEAVKALLDFGADIEQKNKYGLTPLHLCCRSGSVEVLSLLLKYGADINATCEKGKVPFQYVAEREDETELFQSYFEDTIYFYSRYHYYNLLYISCAEMKKSLQDQMYIMYLLGFELQQFNKDLVKKTINKYQISSYQEMKDYMKSCRIDNQVTLYRVITDFRNPIYIRNLSARHKLDQACVSANARYPGLGNIVKSLSKSAKVRIDLMDKGLEWFMYLNAKNNELHQLPPEILEVVFSYLLNEDIQQFVSCMEDLDHHDEAVSQRKLPNYPLSFIV